MLQLTKKICHLSLYAILIAFAIVPLMGKSKKGIEAELFPSHFNVSSLNGTNGFIISGISNGDQSGCSVSYAGDINADGIDDFLIGAPNAKGNNGQTYVVFGSKQKWPSAFNLVSLNGNNGFIIDGINKNDNNGFSTSDAGDINGDGIDDFLITSPREGSTYCEGYAIFGSKQKWPATVSLSNLNGNNGFTIKHPNSKSIATVSRAGDINGDGINDILISGDIGNGNGQSYVIFGGKRWSSVIDLTKLDGQNGFIINGIKDGIKGFAISAAGDINGDGVDDILIGDDYYNSQTGQSYVVFGSKAKWSPTIYLEDLNGNNGFAIEGIDDFDSSGIAVKGVGDINRDGIDDILIGGYLANSAGQAYVVFGKKGKWPGKIYLKDLNGQNGFILNGIKSGDWCGRSVGAAGDFNGDNFDDLLIGAPHANINLKGESYVVFGTNRTWPRIINLADLNGKNGFIINGIHQGDWFGFSVNYAGDINGDGKDDIIMGAFNANNKAGQSYVIFGQ